MEEPGKELEKQEARTCTVCGTKFFATGYREFCPVCILHRAFGAESAANKEPGSVSGSAARALRRLTVGCKLGDLSTMR